MSESTKKGLVPVLRFPEFRDTGEWEAKKIGQVLIVHARPIKMDDEQDYSLVTVKRRYGGVVSRGVIKGKAIKVKSQFLLSEKIFLFQSDKLCTVPVGLFQQNLKVRSFLMNTPY